MALLTICHLVRGNPVICPQQVGWRLFPLDPALLRRLDPALAQSSHELHYPMDHTALSAVQQQQDGRLLSLGDVQTLPMHSSTLVFLMYSCATMLVGCILSIGSRYSARRDAMGGCQGAHFFSSHLEGMKRRLGSGAADRELISLSRVNQSISGSKGFTCASTVQDQSSVMGKECLLPGCTCMGHSHNHAKQPCLASYGC